MFISHLLILCDANDGPFSTYSTTLDKHARNNSLGDLWNLSHKKIFLNGYFLVNFNHKIYVKYVKYVKNFQPNVQEYLENTFEKRFS